MGIKTIFPMFDLFTMFFLVQLFFLHLYYIHVSKNNTIFIYIMMGIFYIILYLSYFALQIFDVPVCSVRPPPPGEIVAKQQNPDNCPSKGTVPCAHGQATRQVFPKVNLLEPGFASLTVPNHDPNPPGGWSQTLS